MESHLKMRENENVWWAAQPPEVSTVQCLEPVNEPYVAKGTSQVFSRVRTREGAIVLNYPDRAKLITGVFKIRDPSQLQSEI